MVMKVNKHSIRSLRLERSWSQDRLAEETGMNLRTIQRIEKDGVASLQSIAALSETLGISPLEIQMEAPVAVCW